MEQAQNVDYVCPSCGKVDSIDLSDGQRLCLQCKNEWKPGAAPAVVETVPTFDGTAGPVRNVVERILAASDSGAVLTPDDDDDDTPDNVLPFAAPTREVPADWCGYFARTPEGVVIVVTVDEGGSLITGVDAETGEHTVLKSECVFVGDDPVGPGEVVHDSAPADDDPNVPTIFAVAGLALTVALECVPDDSNAMLTQPRIGWLPPPCDQVPEVEWGVAFAIANLVRIFGLDKGEVAKLAANMLTGAEAGTETETEQ